MYLIVATESTRKRWWELWFGLFRTEMDVAQSVVAVIVVVVAVAVVKKRSFFVSKDFCV